MHPFRFLTLLVVAGALAGAGRPVSADILVANSTSNNGGLSGWAIFFDLESLGQALSVTELTTANTAAANGAYSVEVLVRSGTALTGVGGSAGSGPGSSMAGWTSLGVAAAMQGPTSGAISNPIDIPDISVGAGDVVGVALRFTTAGPRYFGTGTPPYQVFTDANNLLQMTTGDGRSAPFTTGGSSFASRGYVGSLTFSVVPEPATASLCGLACLIAICGRHRRRQG